LDILVSLYTSIFNFILDLEDKLATSNPLVSDENNCGSGGETSQEVSPYLFDPLFWDQLYLLSKGKSWILKGERERRRGSIGTIEEKLASIL
jgi:hypothetical protein